jgi:hypothetical protein
MKRPLKRRAGKKKLAKTSEAPAHDNPIIAAYGDLFQVALHHH